MIEITRLFDFPYYQLETYNLEKAFTTKYNGEWKSTSTKEYIDLANTVSRGLLKLGVKPNDKIDFSASIRFPKIKNFLQKNFVEYEDFYKYRILKRVNE